MFVRCTIYNPDDPFAVVEEIHRIKPENLKRFKAQAKRNAKGYDFRAKVTFIIYLEDCDYDEI